MNNSRLNTKTKYLTKSHAAKAWLRKHARALGGGWFELPGKARIQGRRNVADKLIREYKLKVNCTCHWKRLQGDIRHCGTCPAQFVEADSK